MDYESQAAKLGGIFGVSATEVTPKADVQVPRSGKDSNTARIQMLTCHSYKDIKVHVYRRF